MRKPRETPDAEAAGQHVRPKGPEAELQALASDIARTIEDQQGLDVSEDATNKAVRELSEISQQVGKTAVQIVRREQAEQARHSEEVERARRAGRIPPQRTAPLSTFDDDSIPFDRDGELAGTPGKLKRWVRMIDSSERPSGEQSSRYARAGYETVKSRVDGQPITRFRHILMEASVEAEAQRKAAAMQGLVQSDRDNEAEFRETVESMNRSFGRSGAFSGFAPEGSARSSERRFEAVSPAELAEAD